MFALIFTKEVTADDHRLELEVITLVGAICHAPLRRE